MRYLDLFSGIGGFALAFKNAGFDFDNHYFSEVDKYATDIYSRHFPDAIRLGDVKRIGNDLKEIDIITGGFPCQAFSIAGGRRGFADTRGTLFFEIERLAGIYKPAYMVLENVKGLLSHDKGNTVRTILERLTGLDYHVQLLLLNTKDFGIPQHRERLFFICTFRGKPRPEISGIRERNKGNFKEIYGTAIRGRNKTLSGCLDTRGCNAFDRADLDKIIFDYDNATIRRLTPLECERLQGFPDNWTDGISDTQRYKTLGNAVTVKVVEEIGKTIKAVLV